MKAYKSLQWCAREILEDIDELMESGNGNLVLAKKALEVGNTHRTVMYLTMTLLSVEPGQRMELIGKINNITNKLDEQCG